jgi:hypothetical protein
MVRRCELESSGSGWETVVGFCEHGNEPFGSIKAREFLDCVTHTFSRRTPLHGFCWLG